MLWPTRATTAMELDPPSVDQLLGLVHAAE